MVDLVVEVGLVLSVAFFTAGVTGVVRLLRSRSTKPPPRAEIVTPCGYRVTYAERWAAGPPPPPPRWPVGDDEPQPSEAYAGAIASTVAGLPLLT
jgi:hypothetical protein